jgi:HlyD family secretion protein
MNLNNVAVTMTDPSKLEAVVLVNEIDIFNVKINGTASVQADAAQGLTVPATVTYIEPTATVQSGVVNYHVKVELIPPTSTNSTQAGRTTAPNRQSGASSAGSSAVSFANLRQGLSVTVNILKENKQNVLLVPNKAITRQGTATSIQALQSNGTIETRTVQVGASDSRNTEVTQGLNEGDKVVVQSSATRAATPASGFGPFGGMGR